MIQHQTTQPKLDLRRRDDFYLKRTICQPPFQDNGAVHTGTHAVGWVVISIAQSYRLFQRGIDNGNSWRSGIIAVPVVFESAKSLDLLNRPAPCDTFLVRSFILIHGWRCRSSCLPSSELPGKRNSTAGSLDRVIHTCGPHRC